MTYNLFVGGGGGTYAGDPYVPDEVAKKIVADLKLRDGDTVSKDQIVQYLEQYGLSSSWAPETAMTLRNMFGVTPTFFEEYSEHATALMEEMGSVFGREQTNDTEDFNNEDMKVIYGKAIQEAFNNAKDAEEEAIIAALSVESLETVTAIIDIDNWLSEEQLIQWESVFNAGGDELVEHWYNAVQRPHMIRFMSESVVSALAEAIGCSPDNLEEAVPTAVKLQRKRAADMERNMRAKVSANAQDVAPEKMDRAVQGNLASMNKEDPLAARAADNKNLLFRHQMDKGAAGMQRMFQGKAQSSGQGEKQFVDKQMSRATRAAQAAKANPLPLPSHEPPQPGMARQAMSALGRVAKGAGNVIGGVAKRVMTPGAPANANASAQAPAGPGPSVPPTSAQAPASAQAPQAAAPPEPDNDEFGASKPSFARKVLNVAKTVGKGALKGAAGLGRATLGGAVGALAGAHTGQGALGRIGGMIKGGVGGAIKGATGTMGDIGNMAQNAKHIMRARSRIRSPALTWALHGAPKEDELRAAGQMGLHKQYGKLGYDLNAASAQPSQSDGQSDRIPGASGAERMGAPEAQAPGRRRKNVPPPPFAQED